MRVLNFRSKEVQQALAHPLLSGRKLLARGSFSAVYELDNNVAKVTIDTSSVQLLRSAKNAYPALPKLIRDRGTIGQMSTGREIVLLELERLYTLSRNDAVYRRASVIRKIMAAEISKVWFAGMKKDMDYEKVFSHALPALIDVPGITVDLIRALRFVACSTRNQNYGLDLHMRNWMYRGAGKELVLADPIADYDTYNHL